MNYPYSESNRLQEPHTYTYSSYGGLDFLRCYIRDRLERLHILCPSSKSHYGVDERSAYHVLHALLGSQSDFPPSATTPLLATLSKEAKYIIGNQPNTNFSVDSTVHTEALLKMLLNRLLNLSADAPVMAEAMLWTDRLLQRFEVSKKLFTEYLPGFRKGAGTTDHIELYQRFALVLALAYAHKQALQYLSTLLKVNDLLLSLPKESYSACNQGTLALTVAVELHSVRGLARFRGVVLDTF